MNRPRRNERLHARLRTRELELLRAAARTHETTVSELVRQAALREAHRILTTGAPGASR